MNSKLSSGWAVVWDDCANEETPEEELVHSFRRSFRMKLRMVLTFSNDITDTPYDTWQEKCEQDALNDLYTENER